MDDELKNMGTGFSHNGITRLCRRERVWRGLGRLENLTFASKVVLNQGGSVMVWGGINYGSRTSFIVIQLTMHHGCW